MRVRGLSRLICLLSFLLSASAFAEEEAPAPAPAKLTKAPQLLKFVQAPYPKSALELQKESVVVMALAIAWRKEIAAALLYCLQTSAPS